MGFYDLSKKERKRLVDRIGEAIKLDLGGKRYKNIRRYASSRDTHVRRNVYLILGKLYHEGMGKHVLNVLECLFRDNNERVRQTAVYALGEIGKSDADKVLKMLEKALNDTHHSVGNAVVGALKRMGEKNPGPVLRFAKRFLHSPDPRIRRVVIHGIELRGRTHPEDVLPLLAEAQNDPERRVRKTIVHVLGQISYKKGCLEKVVSALKSWKNKELVEKALKEILDVHRRYEKFSAKSYSCLLYTSPSPRD